MNQRDNTSTHEKHDAVDLYQQPEGHLAPLEERFTEALGCLDRGEHERADTLLRGILKEEPRLAEPRLELARLMLDRGDLLDAEEEAKEAIRLLEAGGQWNLDLPENVMLSLSHGLLGEVLRQRAESDEAVFGDEATFDDLTSRSLQHFNRAATLDPENEHAAYHAGVMAHRSS